MAYQLTALLGNELKTAIAPRQMAKKLVGYAGANGLTGIHLGSRGYTMAIQGVIREWASTYNAARSQAVSQVAAIEALQALTEADYLYKGDTYLSCIFEDFRLLAGPDGKTFLWDGQQCTVWFAIVLRSLI